MRLNYWFRFVVLAMALTSMQNIFAQEQQALPTVKVYQVQPGDILAINVWKEEGLQQEVLVRPDGGISFPLVGDLQAQGKSLHAIELQISEKLNQYIADPVVTISAKQLLGNKIFVIGKVNKPGEYVVNRYVDIMQALSMAGGMTPFSAVNDIKILRRDKLGKQQAIEFRYGDVEDGDDLEQNIILKSGDVVVVP
ncbi:MAG: polysaccharide biosynthesis/export protein [Methyloprofundus sp.]|nr:MAG: polysaccharide biosynthesis/export protein [Methyloprofundus sp.]